MTHSQCVLRNLLYLIVIIMWIAVVVVNRTNRQDSDPEDPGHTADEREKSSGEEKTGGEEEETPDSQTKSEEKEHSGEVKESSKDGKSVHVKEQEEGKQEEEVRQDLQGGNVENQGDPNEDGNDSSGTIGVAASQVEDTGTSGSEKHEVDTDVKIENVNEAEETKNEAVGEKDEPPGGVLVPVVSDTDTQVLQDPTLIQTGEGEGGEGKGAPSPPTVKAPDGRDYKAPVEERAEEGASDNVQLPQLDEEPGEIDREKEEDRGDKETQPETVVPVDTEPVYEEEVMKSSDDILSFQEWKDKKLQELAMEEKAKILEGTQTQNGKSKSHKNRANYAAAVCGGKVQASNPEAKNTGFILTENKDNYMIQPCNAKKWFVVELCEPVKVEDLELGNLELFSSLPETFLVSVSDRYPTKEWKVLGTFLAREERAVQSFHIGDDMYAKYVKVEMLTHLGKEHYCPLTILRVHGVTLHDDEIEEEPHHEGVEESSEERPARTLFDNAKDTVLSLVKTVLNGDSDSADTKTGDSESDTDPAAADLKNLSVETGTGDNMVADTDPCPPDVRINGDSSTVPTHPPDQPEVPRVDSRASCRQPLVRLIEIPQTHLPSALSGCDFCEGQTHRSHCMWDKYSLCGYYRVCRFVYPTCCLYPPLKGDSKDRGDAKEQSKEVEQRDSSTETSGKGDAETVTTETKDDLKVKIQEGNERSEEEERKDEMKNQKEEGGAKNEGGQDKTVTPDLDKDKSISTEDNVINTAPEVETKGDVGSTLGGGDEKKVELEGNQGTRDTQNTDTSHYHSDKPTQASDSVRTDSTADATATVKMEKTQTPNDQTAPSMHGPDLVKIWPSDRKVGHTEEGDKEHTEAAEQGEEAEAKPEAGDTKDDLEKVTEDGPSEVEPESPDTKPAESSQKKVKDSDEAKEDGTEMTQPGSDGQEVVKESGQPEKESDHGVIEGSTVTPPIQTGGGEGEEKIIYANVPSTDEQENIQEHAAGPVDDEAGGQKYRSTQKETMYMKLRNKIKELEINLTLSSRYLEELSVKYRQRMEEMYKSLNKTIQKLTNTSRTAELRDQKQQDRISSLEKKMEHLSDHMTSLIASIDGIHHEVIERHLYILLLECAIFLAVICWCLTKQKHHYKERMRTVSNSYFNMTAKNNPVTTPAKGHRRGNSVDISTPSKQKTGNGVVCGTSGVEEVEGVMKKSGSENDITVIEPSLPFFICTNPDKKKKKKTKTQQTQGPTVTPSTGHSTARPSQLISYRLDKALNTRGKPSHTSSTDSQTGKHTASTQTVYNSSTLTGENNNKHLKENGGLPSTKNQNGATGIESANQTQHRLINGASKGEFSNYATQNVFSVLQVESPPRSEPKYSEKHAETAAHQPRKRLEVQFNGNGSTENGFDTWEENGKFNHKDGESLFSSESRNVKDRKKSSGGYQNGNTGSVGKEKGLITDLSHQKTKGENWTKRKR